MKGYLARNCTVLVFLISWFIFDIEASCNKALGMETGRLTDGQITSPSVRDNNTMPHHARRGNAMAWCSAAKQFSHLQVRLGREYVITAVSIQGGGFSTLKWVTEYSLRYSQGGHWKWYKENGRKKVLDGVTKFFKEKKSLLRAVTADAIRIYPHKVHGVSSGSNRIEHACLRLELFGCPAIECRRLFAPVHGHMLVSSFKHPAQVKYFCDVGYRLSGHSSLTCRHDGRWSGKEPICKVVHCGQLKAPINGYKKSETSTVHRGVVEFSCDIGYQLIGSSVRRCLASGQWSGHNVSCTAVSCGDPGIPRNCVRDVPHGFIYGSVIKYHCFPGHVRVGSGKIVCQDNKRWSASLPKCLAPCPNPGNPSFGIRIGENFQHGGIVRFQCARGYILSGSPKIQCVDGKWSGNTPRCSVSLASCVNPGKLQHGIIYGNHFRHGMVLRFSCVKGYNLVGARTIMCSDGVWSSPLPRCVARFKTIGFETTVHVFTEGFNDYRQSTLPTTASQPGRKCQPVGIWKTVPGMKKWCNINCPFGNCPKSHCSCG